VPHRATSGVAEQAGVPGVARRVERRAVVVSSDQPRERSRANVRWRQAGDHRDGIFDDSAFEVRRGTSTVRVIDR